MTGGSTTNKKPSNSPTPQQQQQQQQPDYIFRPEDPEHSYTRDPNSEFSTSHASRTATLSERYQDITGTMDQNETKSLTRMQILTPLSVLLQMGVMILCGSKLIKPNLQQVSRRHPTYLSVQDSFVLFYWAVLYVLLIGFSVFLLLSRTPETKKALVHGVGTRLALANYLMVLWAVFWVLDRPITFILGTVTLGLIACLLLWNCMVLALKYPPSARHPLDWLFIHVPIKMFLVITLQYDLFQQLFMALGWDFGSGGHYALLSSLWPGFGIITGLGVFSGLWIFATSDLTWTVAGVYLNIGLLWHKHFSLIGGKDDGEARPAPLTAAIILSISLQIVALIASIAWKRIKARQEGRIALPITPEEEAAAYRAEAERNARAAQQASARAASSSRPTDIGQEEAAAESSGTLATASHAEPGSEVSSEPITPTKVTRKLGGSTPAKKK